MKFKLLILSIFFTSCSSNIGTLSIASTKDVDLEAKYKNIGIVKGKHHIPWLIIPLGDINKFDTAIENTLNDNNISYLTALKIDKVQVWLYLFGLTTYKVEGIGWRKNQSKFDPLTGEPL